MERESNGELIVTPRRPRGRPPGRRSPIPPNIAKQRLLIEFARDLSTMTPDEIRSKWPERTREAIDSISGPGAFNRALENHNPIFYLAEKIGFDNNLNLLHPPLHRDQLCTALLNHYLDDSGYYSGLVVLLPRDSFKTTFMQGVFPTFIALRAKHLHGRDERVALVHHKEHQASANLQRLRAKFIAHPWLKKIWPEFCARTEFGTKTAFDWPCRVPGVMADPSIVAAGLGARLTGFHFDWMIFDDIVTEEHKDSKLLRDEAFGKYQASRFMLDSLRGKEICSGTRYHIHDLWQKLLDAKDESRPPGDQHLYKRLILKAISDDDNTLLFPNRLTYELLEQRRKEEIARCGNDTYWHLQYQLEPRTSNQIVTEPGWLKTARFADVPPTAWRVILVDPAWKGTTNFGKGDYTSIQIWAFERRGPIVVRYLLDGIHSNELTSADGEREIFRLMQQYGITDIAIEEHGGRAFSGMMQNSATTRGRFINFIPLKTSNRQKQDRIAVFLREVQSGMVFLCEEMNPDLRAAFLEQYETFPQCIDELCDALDCAAYSSDPSIAESYVPAFNAMTSFEPEPFMEERHRTRYCGS